MSDSLEMETAEDELVLEPPKPVRPITPEKASATVRVDEETAKRITAAVEMFVDSIVGMDAHSPEFERKVRSIHRMGN